MIIDTHCHIFLPEFENDRDEVIQNALKTGISGFVLPNVDSSTVESLNQLAAAYPKRMFPLMGLHPTSVEEDYKKELDIIRSYLDQGTYYGIGEIGMDLYWDKSFVKEQEDAFTTQLRWAQELDLPVVIHIRDSFYETVRAINSVGGQHRGIFHCFTGTIEEAQIAIDLGFHLGIGGVLTFKNSGLDQVVANIDPQHLVIETDAPYLAPHPKRGKRNEPAYLSYTLNKLADTLNLHRDQIAEQTSLNAQKIFRI